MSLEDAKIFKKDMYALNADFTSAFETIDHDRMLWVMYKLGFPTDAIDAVKNLYQDATSQISRYTQKIPIERGTIKVTHSLPSSSSSTWNPFLDGSMLEDVATSIAASRTKA